MAVGIVLVIFGLTLTPKGTDGTLHYSPNLIISAVGLLLLYPSVYLWTGIRPPADKLDLEQLRARRRALSDKINRFEKERDVVQKLIQKHEDEKRRKLEQEGRKAEAKLNELMVVATNEPGAKMILDKTKRGGIWIGIAGIVISLIAPVIQDLYNWVFK